MNKPIKKKLSEIASGTDAEWLNEAKYRRENREWLRKSAIIAIKVLAALRAQGLTQKDLAEKMNVSPQQISKIVKGHENLTLETITHLEKALGIQIMPEYINDGKSAA
ncbi:MAG TPA: helix-turn-helix transcriptional regulator [Chitinophaga sp.]|uniref:helix-turn-helix transcriptional regulator n=1 Tax=Chitinophaga sp. TaxID=1869181 RepID=UPI002C26B878|nr:helix-turn-helix transcriptional regulator [Chitinophaga sp.]HVI47612.1 helix-turn-helix transcriptional regulator [Chitinophaga sp.]